MELKIGNLIAKLPIIQGGMGVGVSMHNLAGNVSKEGGIGVISSADIGYKEEEIADPNDMLMYYKKEDVEKYGVLGIGLKFL